MLQELDIAFFDVVKYDGCYLALKVGLLRDIELLRFFFRRGILLSRVFIVGIFIIFVVTFGII